MRPYVVGLLGLLTILGAGWLALGDRDRDLDRIYADVKRWIGTSAPSAPPAATTAAPSRPVATPAAPAAPAPAAAPPPPPPPPRPSFDIVRVNARGDAVMAGRAAPHAEIEILDGAREIGRVKADDRGEWVFVPAGPMPPGGRELSLRARNPDGSVWESASAVVLVVPERDRDVAGREVAPGAPTPPIALLTPRAPGGALQVLQAPRTDTAPPADAPAEARPSAPRADQTGAAPAAPAPPPPVETPAVAPPAIAAPAPSPAPPPAPPAPTAAPAALAPGTAPAAPASATAAPQSPPPSPAAPAPPVPAIATAPITAPPPGPSPPAAAAPAVAPAPAPAPVQPPVTTASPPTPAPEPPAAPPPIPAPQITAVAPAPAMPRPAEPAPPAPVAAPTLPAAPTIPQGRPPGGISVDVVDYGITGDVSFAGRASPGEAVRLYLDGLHLGDTRADAEGRWNLAPEQQIAPGRTQALRADQVSPDGRVTARVQVPFQRAETPPEGLRPGSIIVQPGHSLWRIARETYGRGIRYTVIYEANREQIRNPDLIYPGQVFVLPGEQGG